MKIIFFSTNSQSFDPNFFHYYNFPTNTTILNKLAQQYPKNEFVIITQLPGLFLLDFEENSELSKNISIKIIPQENDISKIAQIIINEKPDLAIACTFWTAPFDWLTIKDGLVSQILEKNGIKTLCNSCDTGLNCFNKNNFYSFLADDFNHAKGLYINHELFFSHKSRADVNENVYQQYIFEKIKELRLPLVIKDAYGLSSFGVEVVHTYPEAFAYLKSKKNNNDKIIEEYINGVQFGTEIWGTPLSGYIVFDPFMFSLNQYGITSPKQSIKLGPITSEKYKISELKTILQKLAYKLNINGMAQVDLVFSNDKWYVIEVNARLSGMSNCISASANKSIPELLLQTALQNQDFNKTYQSGLFTAIKFPILNSDNLQKLKNTKNLVSLNQAVNDLAKQKRETGYCEIILGNNSCTPQQMLTLLKELKTDFSTIAEESFIEKAVEMVKNCL